MGLKIKENKGVNFMNQVEVPVLFKRKEECCGCTACYAICPKNAISMIEDEEGFLYPRINKNKCISCYQCFKVCPVKKSRK